MKLNDDLKLVLDVGDYSAYHQPITNAVYEANFLILSSTQSSIFGRGIKHAMSVGPRIAALTLQDEGRRIAEERDEEDDFGASALLGEIRRTTTILVPSENGWDYLTVDAAINQKKIDFEDWKETESAIVFFTCAYYSLPRRARDEVLSVLMEALGAHTTVLSCEEYANSSKMSKPEETGEKPVSSVPV